MYAAFLPALVAGAMLIGGLAQAQTATGTLGVSAVVTRICTLSATPLIFGNLSTLATNDASAVIKLECNGASTVTTVLVSMGANALPPTTQRNMIFETNIMPYSLHLVQGDNTDIATSGAVPLAKQADSNIYKATIFGEIAPNEDYVMGAYSDTVVLTAVYAP